MKKRHSVGHDLERTAETIGIVVEAVCIKFPAATFEFAKETLRKVRVNT